MLLNTATTRGAREKTVLAATTTTTTVSPKKEEEGVGSMAQKEKETDVGRVR